MDDLPWPNEIPAFPFLTHISLTATAAAQRSNQELLAVLVSTRSIVAVQVGELPLMDQRLFRQGKGVYGYCTTHHILSSSPLVE